MARRVGRKRCFVPTSNSTREIHVRCLVFSRLWKLRRRPRPWKQFERSLRRVGKTRTFRLKLETSKQLPNAEEDGMQATQLRYVIKFVADMDKAVKFHRDVLGLKLKFES